MRKFEVALKMVDGKVLTKFNEETNSAELVYWDVDADDMPSYATKFAAGADFKCAEDVVIKSIWKQLFKTGFFDVIRTAKSALTGLIHTNKDEDSFEKSLNTDDRKNIKEIMAPTLVHTGIKAKMEEDDVLYIMNRSSGPSKLGLVLANSIGVIDADYYGNKKTDGEIMFSFYNFLPFDVTIKKGDKIGQGVFHKYLREDNPVVGGERIGGFGSTDLQK